MAPLAASLAAFVLAAGLLTVTPGLDTMLVLRTAAVEGRRGALLAALGICAGCLVWGLVVALGLGALLAASALAYRILRYAGAAYLLWLGLKLLVAKRAVPVAREDGLQHAGGGLADFRRGLFTNLLNPKVGIFYVSFLPQFIPAGMEVASMTFLLAAIHAIMGLCWLSLLVAGADRVARILRRPATMRALDRITGGVFLLFGLKLALDRH